mmetsp:Transcript_39504/g.106002  ORF Transcript_39504/g.106002 Transcript_39504/m.106002 type:complete len:238 (+) Transcript_39504:215-928(+)
MDCTAKTVQAHLIARTRSPARAQTRARPPAHLPPTAAQSAGAPPACAGRRSGLQALRTGGGWRPLGPLGPEPAAGPERPAGLQHGHAEQLGAEGHADKGSRRGREAGAEAHAGGVDRAEDDVGEAQGHGGVAAALVPQLPSPPPGPRVIRVPHGLQVAHLGVEGLQAAEDDDHQAYDLVRQPEVGRLLPEDDEDEAKELEEHAYRHQPTVALEPQGHAPRLPLVLPQIMGPDDPQRQ